MSKLNDIRHERKKLSRRIRDAYQRKRIYLLTTLLLMVAIPVMTISLVKICYSGGHLAYLNLRIVSYNTSFVKTDEGAEEYEESILERQEVFYESDDNVIRLYSNLPWALKLALFVGSIFAIPVVVCGGIYCLLYEVALLISTQKKISHFEQERAELTVEEQREWLRKMQKERSIFQRIG